MIQLFEISQTGQAVLALGIVAVMFALFLREVYPTEVVAIAGAAVLLVSGLLPYDAALEVLSNPAPWTIAVFCCNGVWPPAKVWATDRNPSPLHRPP